MLIIIERSVGRGLIVQEIDFTVSSLGRYVQSFLIKDQASSPQNSGCIHLEWFQQSDIL